MIPITKEFLKNMNREHNWAFGKIVISLAKLVKFDYLQQVKDAELWQQIENKLLKERMYRYLYLEDLVDMTHFMLYNNVGSE